MKRPEIAVLGAGLVGARHVAQAARQARLKAIVDPAPVARALADDHGVPHFAEPADMLVRHRPDGIVIATPNHLHADHAVMCLDRGIPVLIEKPVADTLENADRIVAASERSGVPVLVGHHRRHNPLIERAKALIGDGRLGDIVAANGQFWLFKPDDYFDAAWRRGPGGGPILINCIHDIDLLRYLLGDIAEIRAMRSNRRRGGPVEDTAAILIRFECGALGTFSVSDTIAAPWSWEMTAGENPVYPQLPESCYRIGGTHGALSIPDMRLWSHVGARSWWSDMTVDAQDVVQVDAFARQFAHFLEVLSGRHPRVTAREGRASLSATLDCTAFGVSPV